MHGGALNGRVHASHSMLEKFGFTGCPPSLSTYKSSPVIVLEHAWILSTMFAIGSAIASMIVASSNDNVDSGSKGAGFAAVWSMLMVLSLSWFVYKTLKVWRSAFSVGFSIGAMLTISQLFLCLFALFVGMTEEASKTGGTSTLESDNRAMATFSFFLFVLYGFFGVLLAKYRQYVVVEADGDEHEGGRLNEEDAFHNSESARGLNNPEVDEEEGDGEYEDQDLGGDIQTGVSHSAI